MYRYMYMVITKQLSYIEFFKCKIIFTFYQLVRNIG